MPGLGVQLRALGTADAGLFIAKCRRWAGENKDTGTEQRGGLERTT